MSLNRTEDRCDACGAEALIQVESSTPGYDLIFCRHHYLQFAEALADQGFTVTIDNTGKLTEHNKLVGSHNS